MTADFFRPTLLVGVGGTGCQIAEQVFLEARRNNVDKQDRIGVLVFDTDVKDLRKLTAVPISNQIQISSPEPVFQLLRANPEVEGDWFLRKEDQSPELLNMSILEGAGQIRMVTRLALHNSFRKRDILNKAQGAIAQVASNNGRTAFTGVINILIVGSLAGATGSGSFYQVALMLRELCRKSEVQANITGLFLLPDIYVRTGKALTDQVENVKANAYAALKELNAINVLAMLPQRGAQFSYSYMPGQGLREGETPFSSVTLIDYESSRGGNMGLDIRNYIDLARKAGYLMIFSPLGPSFGAVAINSLLTRISSLFDGRHNLYSGLGISSLSYPALSMRDHLAHQLVLSGLDGNWIRLDEMFRRRIRRHAELKAAGQTIDEEPKIAEEYLRNIEILAEQENVPFFAELWRQLHPEAEVAPGNAPTRKPISKTYVEEFIKHATDSLWRGEVAKIIKERQFRDAGSMATPVEIVEQVRSGENTLDRDFQNLERLLRSEPEAIFLSSWQSAEDLQENQWKDHHIKKWVIADGPHPVRSRTFLYQVQREIKARLAQLDPAAIRKQLLMLASELVRAFSDKGSDSSDKEPVQRGNPGIYRCAEEAAGSGKLFASLRRRFGGREENFSEAYTDYYNTSLRLMRDYADATLQRQSLSLLLPKIESLLQAYTGLFSEIEGIGRELRTTVDTEARRYSRSAGGADGTVWVYADAACREAAWREIQAETASMGSVADVNQTLSSALYEAHRISVEKNKPISFNDLGKLFRDTVVEGFAKGTVNENFRRVWDISVIEAMRRESAMKGVTDFEVYLADQTRLVSRQAEPYVSLRDAETSGQMLKFWALHPQSESDVESRDVFGRLFSGDQGEGALIEPAFSRYDLLCVNFRLNLTLDEFSKLHPGDADYRNINAKPPGEYQQSYTRRIEELIRHGSRGSRTMTPHVHRDWHLPGALPEITPERDQEIRGSVMRAAAISVSFDLFQPLVIDNRDVTHFVTRGRFPGQLDAVDREVADSHDLAAVLDRFSREVDLVRHAEAFWKLASNASRSSRAPTESAMSKLLRPEPVVAMLELAEDRSEPARIDPMVQELVAAWCRLVIEAVGSARRDLGHQARLDMVIAETDAVRQAAMTTLSSRFRPDLARQFEILFDFGRETALKSA